MESQQKEAWAKAIIVAFLTLVCLVLTLVVNWYGREDTLYTHLYYVPILIAAIWYHKKAILLAAFLGAVHIAINISLLGLSDPSIFLRAVIFLFVAGIAGVIAGEKDSLVSRMRQSNKELANIIEFYPDATLIVDNEGKVVAWNRAMEAMTGVPAADMVGRGDMEYAIPFYGRRVPMLIDLVGQPDEVQSRYSDVVVSNGRLEAVTTASKISGNDAPVLHATASKLYDADGRATGAIESIRDITQQKKLEVELGKKLKELEYQHDKLEQQEAELTNQNEELLRVFNMLKDSEEKHRIITESISDGIAATDLQRNVTFFNRRAEEITGYKKDEVIGKSLQALVDAENRPPMEAVYEVIGRGMIAPAFEMAITRKDGRCVPIEANASPMLDPSGRPAGFLIAFRDVTLRRQAEEILKRYQLLSEYAHDIILFVRSDGRIIEANDAALLTYGYRRDELLAMTIADLRAGDSQETIAKQMDLADKGGVIFETVHRGKNGKHIQVEVSSRGVTIGNERVLLSIVRDITERKSGEETLRSKNKELSIISRITAIINRSATIEEILEGTLRGSLELLEMDAGAIYLADPADGTKLVLRSFVPRTEAGFAAEPRKSVKADPALNTERIFCFADGGTPLFRDIFTSRPADVIVPVLLKGFAVGFMAFCSEAGAPKREELPDLMSIGAQLGIAIDNHTLMRTLRATSNYMAEIINESPDAILTADARGNIISANKRAARLLQYDMMELAGMNVAQLLPQDAPGLTLAGDKSYIRDFLRKGGTTITLNISTSRFESGDVPGGFIIALKDLSEIAGLKIEPLTEQAVEGVRRFQFDKGAVYLVDKTKGSDCMDIFADQVTHNIQGLCVTRQNPKKIREQYGLEKTPIVWLNGSDLPTNEQCIKPDNLTGLGATIYKFLAEANDGVVLLDGVEYLVARNGYDSVLKFLHLLNDRVMVSNSGVLLCIDPLALEMRQYHLLKTELQEFEEIGHS